RFRGDRSLARALLEESLARSGRAPAQIRYVHQSLAMLEFEALRFDAARTEINRALASGQPLSLVGALVLTGISRVRPADGDEAAVRAAISAVSSPGLGEQALAQHLLGRFLVDHAQAQEGRGLLRRAIEQADAGGLESRDTNARRARTYSYMTLISAEAKAGAFEAALALFGEELRMPVPASCVLAVSEDDERFVAIARDASGKLVSRFDASRTAPLPQELSGVVGAQVVEALRPCAKVVVLSRPPLHGRAGLLPPELAWSYRSRPEEPPAPRGEGSHLVVMDVTIKRPGLEPLRGWSPEFGAGERREILAAGEATPSRVLRAMEDATEIDLVTHGVVSSASDASHLVLAPEGDGDALSAGRIRQLKLRGEPLVILAACHGGRTAPLQHEPFSLPVAFIQAGARGVIAATVAIPSDREASAFFNAVRVRVRGGATPASALRDERQAWLGGGRGTVWLNSVVLFE
ncbi:MAG TPA: CHAT domain-containing protein, partial [Longimicrobium sp.]|nr:CHAT domain-containing protein [Longimicrobium sp.]